MNNFRTRFHLLARSIRFYLLSQVFSLSLLTVLHLHPSISPLPPPSLIVLNVIHLVSILKSGKKENTRDNRAREDTTRAPLDVADDAFNPVNSCNYSNYL